MRKFSTWILLLSACFAYALSGPLSVKAGSNDSSVGAAAAGGVNNVSGGVTPITDNVSCPEPDPNGVDGVLTQKVVSGGIACYLSTVLTDNMPYVIIIAIILVVWSGIEYMLAQGSLAAQTKAKQRIVGVLGGLMFYLLIRFLIPLIAGGITL